MSITVWLLLLLGFSLSLSSDSALNCRLVLNSMGVYNKLFLLVAVYLIWGYLWAWKYPIYSWCEEHTWWCPYKFTDICCKLFTLCRIRCYGSAASNLCRIAQGAGDAYVEYGIHIWDFVAGMLIVQEAGAVTKDPSGKRWPRVRGGIIITCLQLSGQSWHSS